METNKLIAGIVAAAIAVIVLAGVLMPALSNATTTEETFKNEGYFFVSTLESTATDTYTLAWDHSDPLKVTVNGDEITLGVPTFYTYSLICADDWILRYETNTDGTSVTVAYGGSENYAVISASTTAATDIQVVLNGGTATFTVGETTVTKTYTKCYCVDTAGDYVMKKADKIAHLHEDSPIYIIGVSNWYGATARVKITGTIEDSFTISIVNHNTWTVSDIVVTAPENDKYIDLYDFDKIEFTVNMDPSGTRDLTYSQVIVPYEVTAERSVHLSDAMNVILNVIPLLIIVAVLFGVVAIFILRRE